MSRVRARTGLALWGGLFLVLAGLFYLAGDRPSPTADSARPLVLLTEDGPVAMTMAEYLSRAVAAEMPVSFGAEALKAQAVAARTFALACRRHRQADLCADSGCCVAYLDESDLRAAWGRDYEKNMRAVMDAVAATDGEYLAYEGEPIQAAFHASSLGCTEDSGAIWSPLPYLVSVESPERPEDDPDLVTTQRLSAAQLAKALALVPRTDPENWLGPVQLDGAGRVQEIFFCDKRFSGGEARSRLGLRSTAFTAAWDGELFVFTVSGYGHGVGMSQWGAAVYGARGASYRDILAHYYPGTDLRSYASEGPRK